MNGVQVTDDNASDILGDGTASYNASSNTLTLNGAEITKSIDMISAPGIASSEELTIVLVGTNSINMTSSSTSANGITTQNGLTIKGSGTLEITTKGNGIWNNAGTLTISGVTLGVDTTSGESAAIKSDGRITVDQGASLTLESAGQEPGMRSDPNSSSDNGWISITDSTVNITCGEGEGLIADYDITLTNSDVDITTAWNGIYSWNQDVVVSGGTLDVTTTGTEVNGVCAYETVELVDGADVFVESSGYPAIYGYNLEIKDSTVDTVAADDVALYCDNALRIERSVVQAASGSNKYAGLASGSSVIISDSWVESSGELTTLGAYKNSVIIEGNTGKTTGDLVLPASVTLPQGTTLTVREGTSITVPEGCTLTNNGTIELYGDIIIDGGAGVCAASNHVGGTATCCEKAVCSVCESEYGELDPTNHTTLAHVEAVSATCTEAGTAEHWACDGCGRLFTDAAGTTPTTLEQLAVAAVGHSYVNGVCSACGTEDPSYVEPGKKPQQEQADEKPEIPATGDAASIAPVLAGAGAALSGAVAAWRRRSSRHAA